MAARSGATRDQARVTAWGESPWMVGERSLSRPRMLRLPPSEYKLVHRCGRDFRYSD